MVNKGQEGEDFVNHIAYNSFLKYFCFPGPLDITGDNKEICDLLINFNETLILVSVKNYKFDRNNYERYFRKTIEKAIKQLKGAERKLFGDRTILLNHPDREPVVFEKEKIKDIHRIIVNLNNEVKYYQTSISEESYNISVMDSDAWLSVISELNTIPDFTNYLKNRLNLFSEFPAFILPRQELDFDKRDAQSFYKEIEEKVINQKGKMSIVSGTELDLVAFYIDNGFSFPDQLNHKKVNGISLKLDGYWDKYIKSEIAGKKNDFEKEGYFIEHLIKEVLKEKVHGIEIAKVLFNLNRLERTVFAKHFMEYYNGVINNPENVSWNRTHYIGLNLNLVFICFENNTSKEALKEIITSSILHHAYLHDFKIKTICAIGVSKDFQKYAFGHGKGNISYNQEDLVEIVNNFKNIGWQIK